MSRVPPKGLADESHLLDHTIAPLRSASERTASGAASLVAALRDESLGFSMFFVYL